MFNGLTEHGNATIQDDKEIVEEKELGSIPLRIGHFKAYVFKRHILFSHFWKSEPLTSEANHESRVYVLFFDDDLEPIGFGVFTDKETGPIINAILGVTNNIISMIAFVLTLSYVKQIKLTPKLRMITFLHPAGCGVTKSCGYVYETTIKMNRF